MQGTLTVNIVYKEIGKEERQQEKKYKTKYRESPSSRKIKVCLEKRMVGILSCLCSLFLKIKVKRKFNLWKKPKRRKRLELPDFFLIRSKVSFLAEKGTLLKKKTAKESSERKRGRKEAC